MRVFFLLKSYQDYKRHKNIVDTLIEYITKPSANSL